LLELRGSRGHISGARSSECEANARFLFTRFVPRSNISLQIID
jgi:hypothetical protein